MEYADLKEGDPIAVLADTGYQPTARILTVTRLTPTQIIVGEQRYRRADGRRIGGEYNGPRLLPVDNPRVRSALAKEIVRKAFRKMEHTLHRSVFVTPEAGHALVIDAMRELEETLVELAKLMD